MMVIRMCAMVLSVRLVSDLRLIQRPLERSFGRSMELHGLPSGVRLVGARFAMRVAIPTNEGYPSVLDRSKTGIQLISGWMPCALLSPLKMPLHRSRAYRAGDAEQRRLG